jgi:hypothetical protein
MAQNIGPFSLACLSGNTSFSMRQEENEKAEFEYAGNSFDLSLEPQGRKD